MSEYHFKDEEIVDNKDPMNFTGLQRKNSHLLTYSFQNLNCIGLQKIEWEATGNTYMIQVHFFLMNLSSILTKHLLLG